jgi:hypothetical protein
MYHEVGIQALSPKQISRILNGHAVRVKSGSGAKMHVSSEHAKKLHRAHLKGSAVTVTLDPYAIEKNQHLRTHVGRVSHKALTGKGPKGLKKFQKWTGAIGEFLKPVAKPILGALTEQAVHNINAYGDQSASMAGMPGMGVRKPHRAKRVMSEAQKAALAKGRHALRLKLTEMGAGRAPRAHRVHHGKALMPAGYGMEEYC